MSLRIIAFVIIGLALGGCMQETLEPATQAGWNARDKLLMSDLPYQQADIPEPYRRHVVEYTRKEAPGTVVVDSDNKFLYYVLPGGKAIRYGIAVGEEAQAWNGIAKIGRMSKSGRRGFRPQASSSGSGRCRPIVTGGPHNPMGSRAHVSVFRRQGHAVPHSWHQSA